MRSRSYNDPAWVQGMKDEIGGFPAVHSTDDSGAPENLPGGSWCFGGAASLSDSMVKLAVLWCVHARFSVSLFQGDTVVQ